MHGVSPADITSNHPLMRDVLSNLPPQLGFYLEILQRVKVLQRLRLTMLHEGIYKALRRDGWRRRNIVGLRERESR